MDTQIKGIFELKGNGQICSQNGLNFILKYFAIFFITNLKNFIKV